MKANPLGRVPAAKTTTFVGLAMLVAVAALGLLSAFSAAQQPTASPSAPAQAPAKPNISAATVINANGGGAGFPITGTYTSKGGTLILYVSGSGFSGAANKIGMTVLVEGAKKGTVWSYTNEASSHKAFVPAALVVRNQPAGQLQIELDNAGYPNTNIDQNDNFKVTVLEIPK